MTEDERYKQLQNEKQTAINEANQTYDNLLRENTALSNNVNDYLNQYQTTQSGIYDSQLQREQEKADLGKKKAEEEFNKEAIASKNAYYDFANPYGVQRELQVQQGLGNSGYSETVKSQAWTAQQNRTAQARATMNQAKLQFDEDMKDARLNNDVLKAQLALDTLRMKQDETLRNFNYRSDMMQTRLANSQALDSEYNNRYNTIWNQINTENQQKEAIRQFNKNYELQQNQLKQDQNQFDAKMQYQKDRDKVADNQWEKEYALSQQKINNSSSGGSGYYGSLTDTTGINLNDNSQVSTPYYRGTINPDANKYGTFSNGYQPKGISGHGELANTGYTWVMDTAAKYGEDAGKTKTVKQNVWQAQDGTLWYWEGRENKYKQINPNEYNW